MKSETRLEHTFIMFPFLSPQTLLPFSLFLSLFSGVEEVYVLVVLGFNQNFKAARENSEEKGRESMHEDTHDGRRNSGRQALIIATTSFSLQFSPKTNFLCKTTSSRLKMSFRERKWKSWSCSSSSSVSCQGEEENAKQKTEQASKLVYV